MSLRYAALPLLAVLLLACDPTGTSCPPCPTCPASPETADWGAVLNGLVAGATPTGAPPFDNGGDAQFFEGETALKVKDASDATGFREVGRVHTVQPALATDPWTERWVVYEAGALQQAAGTVYVEYVPRPSLAAAALDQARLDAYRNADTADTSRTYSLARETFFYFPFPQTSTITALPLGLSPGVAAPQTWEVWTVKAGTPSLSGGLYREYRTSGGVQLWSDHWVLFNNFESPGPTGTFAELRPVYGAGAHPYLRAFLTAMSAANGGDTTGFKYVAILDYSWAVPLPATVP
jgi:hypothetical protein